MVLIKGHEFREITVRDSHNRRAQQYANTLIKNLKLFGVPEDDVDIPLERIAIKKTQASVSWYMDGQHLFFSYKKSERYVDNLAMIVQVIEHFLLEVAKKEITLEEFMGMFHEETDIHKQREEARETLGVEKDSMDFDAMHKNYKQLSKKYHPDMPEGDAELFKKINKAHKIVKKELG